MSSLRNKNKNKNKSEKKNKANWLTTYSDMVTLLMVFFIILLSFGEVNEVRTQIILSAFSGQLGLLSGGQSLEAEEEFETLGQAVESLPAERDDSNLERSTQPASSILNPYVRSKYIRIRENEKGVVISLFTDIFFNPSEAELNTEVAREVLENVRLIIDSQQFKGGVLIEGHTDNVSYIGEKYRDLFDLSIARAWAVMDAIRNIDSVYLLNEERISIHGYGPYHPVEENNTPQGRAYNRRVDIFLERN